MPDTVAGLFKTRSEADLALRNLKDSGFGPDQLSLSTPRVRRRAHYGLKVALGIVLGAVIGALIGAVLTGAVPGVKPIVSGDLLATFLLTATAGAATGAVAGGLLSMSASGDRALYYEQEVESGRYLVTVVGPGLEEARRIMSAAGAMESAPIEAPLRPESG